jgi:hypothetical protein
MTGGKELSLKSHCLPTYAQVLSAQDPNLPSIRLFFRRYGARFAQALAF